MSYDIAISLTIVLFSFVFAYLSVNTSKKHGALQILFLISSILFMVVDAGVIAWIATDAGKTDLHDMLNNTVFNGTTWIFIIVVFYFVIYFIYTVAMNMANKRKEEEFG